MKISFREAIDTGEYHPESLEQHEEWKSLTDFQKLSYIKKAMDNRVKALNVQIAEIYNTLDFREKPELKKIVQNLIEHIKRIEEDRIKYYEIYSKGI